MANMEQSTEQFYGHEKIIDNKQQTQSPVINTIAEAGQETE